MAKRFTDTNKWRKEFIRGLQGAYKLLWLYIIDECDHAGIWHVEFDVAELRIGMQINEAEALKQFNGHIIVFDNNLKWFIPDFIEFQYGVLNPENRAHKSVLDQIEKYKLKGHLRSLQGRKDKDKDMDKDKVKEEKVRFDIFWQAYVRKQGSKQTSEKLWDKLKIEEQNSIIESLPGYFDQFTDKTFIPYPSTYLNQRRWENEIIKPKNSLPEKPENYEQFRPKY